jgi:hypothetical protein
MSVKPSEIRKLLAKADAAKTTKAGRYDPEVLAQIGQNREAADAKADAAKARAAAPTKSYADQAPRIIGQGALVSSFGPGVTMDDETEDALSFAAAPVEDTATAPKRKKNPRNDTPAPEMPSKADALRNSGFGGLAELEDMQNSPLGSTSALSGPNSRRMISSPARSIERQARRYEKFGRAGAAAASDLYRTAAGIRIGEPSLRTEEGIKSQQTKNAVADSLAQRAIAGVSEGGNEMPPNQAEADKFNRKKRKGDYMGREGRRNALAPHRRNDQSYDL